MRWGRWKDYCRIVKALGRWSKGVGREGDIKRKIKKLKMLQDAKGLEGLKL